MSTTAKFHRSRTNTNVTATRTQITGDKKTTQNNLIASPITDENSEPNVEKHLPSQEPRKSEYHPDFPSHIPEILITRKHVQDARKETCREPESRLQQGTTDATFSADRNLCSSASSRNEKKRFPVSATMQSPSSIDGGIFHRSPIQRPPTNPKGDNSALQVQKSDAVGSSGANFANSAASRRRSSNISDQIPKRVECTPPRSASKGEGPPSKTNKDSVRATQNLSGRKSHCFRTVGAAAESNRIFVPNPTPEYLKTGRTPEIRHTRKSLQLAQIRSNQNQSPEKLDANGSGKKAPRMSRDRTMNTKGANGSAKKAPRMSLERTVLKPFSLQSIPKHEERMNQIKERLAEEEEEDRRRRDFQPVTLRPEILRGPTFVPKRRSAALTVPVNLLPHAQERSERTLAFEARQRARMEERAQNERLAAEEQEMLEQGKLKREFESRRFKPRPVPNSHYTPDISPARSDAMLRGSERNAIVSEHPLVQVKEEGLETHTNEDIDSSDIQAPSSIVDVSSPVSSGSRAVTILEGIRNSLSPLLGRRSADPTHRE